MNKTVFRQCKLCGQIYTYTGNQFCSNCVRELDKQFRIIKELLYKNPDLTISEVVENTGVDEKIVFYLLKEGRLEMKAATSMLTCETCGQPIRTGRLCPECSSNLSSAFERAIQKMEMQALNKNQEISMSKHTYVNKKNK